MKAFTKLLVLASLTTFIAGVSFADDAAKTGQQAAPKDCRAASDKAAGNAGTSGTQDTGNGGGNAGSANVKKQ